MSTVLNPFEGYEKMIHEWQELDYQALEQLPVTDSLLPLKGFLLGREEEAKELVEAMEFQFIRNTDIAFILEAKLVGGLFDASDTPEVKLASEIVSLFDRAYFANITLAEDNLNQKEYLKALDAYQKAVSIAPNSQKVIADCLYTCIMAEKGREGFEFAELLRSTKEKIFAYAGLLTLSTIYGKAALAILLALFSLLSPWGLIVLLPGLVYFAREWWLNRASENHLIQYISQFYAIYFAIFTGLSLVILLLH